MPKPKKTWTEKLHDHKGLPKVIHLTGEARKKWGGTTMVVPAPADVDAHMRRIPKGKLATINELRAALARQHATDVTCPLTTGIFAWIAAHAAEESAAKNATPYWRTLKNRGEINPKYPGGPLAVCKKLRAEGHKITKKGQRYFVANWEESLADFDPRSE